MSFLEDRSCFMEAVNSCVGSSRVVFEEISFVRRPELFCQNHELVSCCTRIELVISLAKWVSWKTVAVLWKPWTFATLLLVWAEFFSKRQVLWEDRGSRELASYCTRIELWRDKFLEDSRWFHPATLCESTASVISCCGKIHSLKNNFIEYKITI